MNAKSPSLKTGLLASLLALMAMPLAAATLNFDFNLPATGSPSGTPPYPTVATLEIKDIAVGVQMTLTPNWGSDGWKNQNNPAVDSLAIVMPDLSNLTASWISGAPTKNGNGFSFGNMNLDAGYKSNAVSFKVDFQQKNKDPFDSSYLNSIWNVTGADLTTADFENLFATANKKPSPIFGVISVSAYVNGNATSSNWVAGSTPAVPLPAAAYLFGSALLGMVGIGYRRNKKQA